MKSAYRNVIKSLIASTLALAATAHAAPTLLIESGVLTGVTGIMIEGKSFNVDFIDGSCLSAMNPCQGNSFFFKDEGSAFAATFALASQVFAGSDPASGVPGCALRDCWFYTPYLEKNGTVYAAAFHNAYNASDMPDRIEGAVVGITMDYSNATFARWGTTSRAPTEVPEPGSIALLAIGVAGLRFARRKY